MQTLLLKADNGIFEQLKAFLSLLPKDKLEVIDPFNIDFVDKEEQAEIEDILKQTDTHEAAEGSKKIYKI